MGRHSAGDASPRTALLLAQILPLTPGILGRRAWPAGRLAALSATPPFMRWLLEATLVCARSVDGGDRYVVKAQVDAQLSAMMDHVVQDERTQHRCLRHREDCVAAAFQAPRGQKLGI